MMSTANISVLASRATVESPKLIHTKFVKPHYTAELSTITLTLTHSRERNALKVSTNLYQRYHRSGFLTIATRTSWRPQSLQTQASVMFIVRFNERVR